MGNCCRAESPCGSVEERSVLLKDDSKTTCSSEKVVVGTCGPEGANDMRGDAEEEAQMKQQKLENKEAEPINAQENGHLQKENVLEGKDSSSKEPELKEDANREKHDDTPAEKSTLKSLERQRSTAKSEVVVPPNAEPEKEDDPVSVQEKVPGVFSPASEAVKPENPSDPETYSSTEHITLNGTHSGVEDQRSKDVINAVAKPSGEFTLKNEALSVSNTELAAAAGQAASVPEVSQDTNTEAPSCAVTVDVDNNGSSPCKEDGSGDMKSHDLSQSSPGLQPTGHDCSEENLDTESPNKEPEATSPAGAKNRFKSDKDESPDPECSSTADTKEATSSEKTKQDAEEETVSKIQDRDVLEVKKDNETKEEEEEEGAPTEAEASQAEKDTKIQEVTEKQEEEVAGSSGGKSDDGPSTEEEENLENSEEDLYRGAEELSATQILKVEDRCSLSPAVDILSYSEREWKGNTSKSALIKQGYKEMSQKFDGVRRVRGDNYCALRATLFQVLSQSTKLPLWLQNDDVLMLPQQLEAQEGLISQWRFPGERVQGEGSGDAAQQLKGYVRLLRDTWQAAVECPSAPERQKLCERVFQGGEEELGLLEALKLLMLGQAVELHSCMLGGGDVPLFCWLLFARDSSDCPRSFLSNHLRHVGLSAGLEQVEMFLLGYALQHTIQVYRLYKANTEEFITFYPDDHKDDWPTVCLVTEDDRHYNVPVVEAAEPNKELTSS